MSDRLPQLLARAAILEAELETKQAVVAEADQHEAPEEALTPDALEDLREQAADMEVDELEAELDIVREEIAAAEDAGPPVEQWDDFDADPVAEGDPPVEGEPEEKAAGSVTCPDHPNADVDQFADGTAACVECGRALAGETKGYDFDDLDDGVDLDEPEAKADDEPLETKGASEPLTEFDLLRARRAALGTE